MPPTKSGIHPQKKIKMKLIKTTLYSLALAAAVGVTACQENEYGVVDLTPNKEVQPVTGVYTYKHPCAMYDNADFDRVKKSLEDASAPEDVKLAFETLKSSKFTNVNWSPNAVEIVYRGSGTPENYRKAFEDAAAAWQLALMWRLTGENQYGDAAVRILNAWGTTCKQVTGTSDQSLCAGAQGFTFANAAEIMRDYTGWATEDFNAFKKMLVKVFAERNRDFMDRHHGQCYTHYWSNWDLVSLCSYFAIGVLTENNDMINYVVNYFHNGVGNGCIKNLLQGDHIDPLGSGETISQNQESGRDQGHAMMSCAVASNLAQMASTLYKLNPEISQLDFFGADDNALMRMAEYVALTNLRDGSDRLNQEGLWLVGADKIPFSTYNYCIDCACNGGRPHDHGWTQETFADDEKRGGLRPGFEIYYHYYAKVKNLTEGYKYTKMMADKMRPECGPGEPEGRYGNNSGAFDQLGWGTLMLYRE